MSSKNRKNSAPAAVTPETPENVPVEQPVVEQTPEQPVVEQPAPENAPEQTPEQTPEQPADETPETPETPAVETPEAGWIVKADGSNQLHEVETVSMPSFTATCGRTFVAGEPATDRDQKLMAFCAYCLDRVKAPADATDEKPLKAARKSKTAFAPAARQPIFVLGSAYAELARKAGLPNFGRTGDAVAAAIVSLSNARLELLHQPNAGDARALLDVLNATVGIVRPVAGRKPASTSTPTEAMPAERTRSLTVHGNCAGSEQPAARIFDAKFGKRGVCSVCARTNYLNKDGVMGKHVPSKTLAPAVETPVVTVEQSPEQPETVAEPVAETQGQQAETPEELAPAA